MLNDDANERYEKLAAEFYKKHGVMAPGKDEPAAMGQTISDEERMNLWREFLKTKGRII